MSKRVTLSSSLSLAERTMIGTSETDRISRQTSIPFFHGRFMSRIMIFGFSSSNRERASFPF